MATTDPNKEETSSVDEKVLSQEPVSTENEAKSEENSDAKADKSVLDKIEEKKNEAKAIDEASQALAEENNLPSENDPEVVSKGERILSVIGYFSFLCILPLVLKPKSDFCQMHGKQGLILIVIWLLFTPIRFIGDAIFNSTMITGLFGFCYLLVICYGIYLVITEKTDIPVLSVVAKKLNW